MTAWPFEPLRRGCGSACDRSATGGRIPIRSQLLVLRQLLNADACRKVCSRISEAVRLAEFLSAAIATLEWLEKREALIKGLREHPDIADAAMAEIERRRRGETGVHT